MSINWIVSPTARNDEAKILLLRQLFFKELKKTIFRYDVYYK